MRRNKYINFRRKRNLHFYFFINRPCQFKVIFRRYDFDLVCIHRLRLAQDKHISLLLPFDREGHKRRIFVVSYDEVRLVIVDVIILGIRVTLNIRILVLLPKRGFHRIQLAFALTAPRDKAKYSQCKNDVSDHDRANKHHSGLKTESPFGTLAPWLT